MHGGISGDPGAISYDTSAKFTSCIVKAMKARSLTSLYLPLLSNHDNPKRSALIINSGKDQVQGWYYESPTSMITFI